MDRSAYDVFLEMEEKHFWRIAKRRLVLATILRHVAPDAPLRILDIGGCCSLTGKQLETYGEVFRVEPDTAAARVATERLRVTVHPGSLPDDLPGQGPYDLITLLDVLEHVDQDAASLATICASLRPGGWFVCTVPAYMWLWSDHDVSLHHKRHYTRNGLRKLLLAAGFEIHRLTYYTSFLLPLLATDRWRRKLRPQP